MKTAGYSIWLIPQDDTFKKLLKLIKSLSRDYSSPSFSPHVTLIGGVVGQKTQVIKKTKELALGIKQYRIHLRGVVSTDNYLKALFLKVNKKTEVMKANKLARKIFGVEDSEKYSPHLSLMYGDFPESLKKEIIKNNKLNNFKLNFMVDRVHLYQTEGEIKDWKKVGEFKLRLTH